MGNEKAELPHDDMEESEKDEQTEPARSNDGFVLFMRSHSSAGLSSWLKVVYIFGAGVLGGVTARGKVAERGIGESRCADVGCSVGLDISAGTSDISIVGIMAVVSDMTSGSWKGALETRFRLILKVWGRGGGGGSTADCCSGCCASGVLGIWPSVNWKSALGGREMDSEGRRGGMATVC